MTESIYFNTGFVYRFGRTGIVSFGGEESALFEFDTVTWTDKDYTLQKLERVRLERAYPIVDFSSYNKNISGTAKLLGDLVVKGGIGNEYLLGCVIYHQLLYKVPLKAEFLTGYQNNDCCDCDSSDGCNTPFSYSEDESE